MAIFDHVLVPIASEDDAIEIHIEDVGTLENPVTEV